MEQFAFQPDRTSVLTTPTRPDLSSFSYPPYTERAITRARRLF
jgi:aldehyde dehydrogenase (NAD+)